MLFYCALLKCKKIFYLCTWLHVFFFYYCENEFQLLALFICVPFYIQKQFNLFIQNNLIDKCTIMRSFKYILFLECKWIITIVELTKSYQPKYAVKCDETFRGIFNAGLMHNPFQWQTIVCTDNKKYFSLTTVVFSNEIRKLILVTIENTFGLFFVSSAQWFILCGQQWKLNSTNIVIK